MLLTILLGALYRIDPIQVVNAPGKIDYDKGKKFYYSHCISCHHKDPNLKGVIGPEITDVPFEVFSTKVLTGKYPEILPLGYKAKRKTKLMRPLPNVKNDLKLLYSWIQTMQYTKK